ncbi:MAG: hypothetical protein RL701_5780 [Pseudomonadota bacterium]
MPISHEQFLRVLAIELGTSIEFSPSAAQDRDGTVIRVGCSAHGIDLQLNDSVTRKAMQRSVEMPDVDIATRSRLLALAVAEFVVASWVELQLAKPPPIEPVGPRARPEQALHASRLASERLPPPAFPRLREPPSAPTRWLAGVSFEGTAFARGGLGGQLSLHGEQRPSAHLALGLAVSVSHAEWAVRVQNADASARLTSTSGRLSLAFVTTLGPLEWLIGGGARFGLVHIAGRAVQNTRPGLVAVEFYAPWGGPALQLSAASHWDHLRIGLELELGYVTQPVEAVAEGETVAELAGLWGSAGLKLSWLF